MEGQEQDLYEGEPLFTLKINNRNYLTSPLYGKTFLLCCCYQKFDFPTDPKRFIMNLRKHLKTLKCFDFENIRENVFEYLELAKQKRQSNDYCAPMSLDTVFNLPAHVSIINGTLCRFCHTLRSEKKKHRCCEQMMKFKVKVYASNDSNKQMNVLLHSIVDNSLLVKDYLDKAHSRKHLKDHIVDLENQILCLQTDNGILVHQNKLLKENVGAVGIIDDLTYGIIDLPSIESLLENHVAARSLYNQVPNPNLVLTTGEFIRKILNFPRDISGDELLNQHQSFRGTSIHQEQTLANVSLAMMQQINQAIDKS